MLCYDHHTKTCCCFNVQKCAFTFALIGFVFNLMALIPIFLPFWPTSQEIQSLSVGKTFHFAICALMFLSILFAYKLRKSWLYKPYLIYMGVALALSIFGCLTYLYFLIVDPQSLLDEQKRKEHPGKAMADSEARSIAAAWLALMAVYVLFSSWIYSVIYRAYVTQKEEEAGGQFAQMGGEHFSKV
uniref:MARVEL domain-containing protein n=1 Tax=Globodera pallida TaxID=36090 RepID=A0A183BMW8_GLOPA